MTLQEIDDLEAKLHGLTMPAEPYQLRPGTIITNIERFIKTQLHTLRYAPEARTSLPCLWRLEEFIEQVEALQGDRE